MTGVSERAFEEAIEAHLLAHGYLRSEPSNFDPVLGLDTAELFAFIGATQGDAWEDLVARYGGDRNAAQAGFARRLVAELDARGTVDVLRHGVVDLGVTIKLAFFRPAHGLTPELVQRYEANRVSVTRQLRYDPGSGNSLDLVLLVNGIPTATAELKNPLTGQGVEQAKAQYRQDRDPANVTLSKRAVVHFAVDPEQVAMTTRLSGATTRFLPFNQGTGGAGEAGGAGNPPNPGGHRTAYLWERVWQRDAWLDLLARFVHVSTPARPSWGRAAPEREVIFPRFHQWDAVRKLEADAKATGAGQHYLVQHSAGSGKSNTIAWLAHRLANLHDDTDTKVFDKVVVITDRLVLDRQLQETIFQFEHARGVVERIDRDSTQLAEALEGERARIIITTLQKFPYVLDKIGTLPSRRYAVLVDEAHSSQTGEAARELRAVLSGEQALEAAEQAETAEAESRRDPEDQLVVSVAGRGRQPNLSFFAFTATPKAKTLELFGTRVGSGDDARFVPFHLYSMRQAIEEGFILDVLANYTTYKTYWRIEKAVTDDPTYDPARAKRAIARFVELHPHNLAQKAEIIVEHFRTHTRPKIGGRAKAMVVTSSRLHAVGYKQAIDRYIAHHGYTDVAALVAFSGKVVDEGDEFTESGMNRFPESETAERFAGDDYQVLVVAEKFQTGFDQPLLHTMYVDKVLSGLNAVQTLSRLNRIHPDKSDTFVLDFRNDTDDIVKAFAPYYERTVAVPTDPNLVYDLDRQLLASPVIHPDEIEPAVQALLRAKAKAGTEELHGDVYAALDPARDRFVALDEADQDEFRDLMRRFVNLYSFISQVVPYTDPRLERDYLYGRALQACLPGQDSERLDLGSEVVLTHLKVEQTATGTLALPGGTGEVTVLTGDGRRHEPPEAEHLSEIIEVLNERFGLHLTEADQLLFDQFEQSWLADPDLAAQARANTLENFRLVFDRQFMNTIVTRMDDNEAIFKRILDDPEFKGLLEDFYLDRIYQQLREPQP